MGMDNWLVLVHMWHKDGLNKQALGKKLGRNKTIMTRAINWLEEESMVVRIADQHDRRLKRIFLTKKGKDLREEMDPFVKSVVEEASAGVAPQDMKTCKLVLSQVFENLKRYI